MSHKTDIPIVMILYLSAFIHFGAVLLVNSEPGICSKLMSSIKEKMVNKSRRSYYRDQNMYREYGHRNSYYWVTYSTIETYMDQWTEHYCCSGYEKMSESNTPLLCSPICDPKCVNGTCVSPGECKCKEGFKFEGYSAHECVPHCEGGCINGKCTDVDHCSCLEGYKAYNNSACEPKCSSGCTHGHCTAPEVCTCDHGYRRTSQYSCEPICDKECIRGTCSGVNKCTCLKGYFATKEFHWNLCDPECESCVNGYCSGPNKCTCFNGYKQNASNPNICDPVCREGCVNGYCSAPENCECNEGFTPHELHVCKPECNADCVNGECKDTDVCTCWKGYEMVNDECTPICKQNCVNSVCTSPNHCECRFGAVRINDSYCGYFCKENTTVGCWSSIQNAQEHSYKLLKYEPFPSIIMRKESYAMTVETSCHNFLCNYDKECQPDATFACVAWTQYGEEYVQAFCERGNSIRINHFHSKNGVFFLEAPRFEKKAMVIFTYIFPKVDPSPEHCRLCFCDAFHIEITKGDDHKIRLCPCEDQSILKEDFRGSQAELITLICLSLLLVISGVILYIRKRIHRVPRGNSPTVPDIAEEHP